MTLASGTRIGPYDVVALLGTGGMGEVYRARDPRLGRDVAIKVLIEEVTRDRDRLTRLEKEARAASALNHPNIITIHEIGSSDSLKYIAMELVEGVTLRRFFDDGIPPMKKLLQIAAQMADGLARAHASGIVHRDLKPENVMVTRDGFVKILDFGVAKLAHSDMTYAGPTTPTEPVRTQPGTLLGSIGYMSPEQARGQAVDFRSDQFSFGSVLYEMTTGKRAFEKGSAIDTLSAILRDDPEPAGSLNPKAPAQLCWVIDRCLAKDPKERYGATEDLSRDLAVIRDHLSETTSPITSQGRRSKRPLFRFALGSLAAAATLALGVLVGRTILQPSPSPPPRFRQLTFQRGTVFSARFAPDGQTVVYGATWGGQACRVFSTRLDGTESRPVGLPDGDLLSVSSTGELAVALGLRVMRWGTGTLARVPLAGGSPREMLEDVRAADWSPDGKELAIVRDVQGKNILEFPIGRVRYETGHYIHSMRISPAGDRIAFIEDDDNGVGSISVLDLSGRKSTLSRGWSLAHGLAWRPDGSEIWFSASASGFNMWLYAVTLAGRVRPLRQEASGIGLADIFRDGRVLLATYSVSSPVMLRSAGDPSERDLSWLNSSWVEDISADGRTVLFNEPGEGGGSIGSIFLRRADGTPPVRLGDGWGMDFSPDGQWVLTKSLTDPKRFVLLRTRAGQPVFLDHEGIEWGRQGGWFPDGKRIFFLGFAPGRPMRLYSQDLAGGPAKAITPEGLEQGLISLSPDGRYVAAMGRGARVALYPVNGGEPRTAPGAVVGEQPIRWSAEGRSLYVYRRNEVPARVFRLDVETGRRELLTEILPGDPTGLTRIDSVVVTPDGRSYAYSYTRVLSNIHLAEGLR